MPATTTGEALPADQVRRRGARILQTTGGFRAETQEQECIDLTQQQRPRKIWMKLSTLHRLYPLDENRTELLRAEMRKDDFWEGRRIEALDAAIEKAAERLRRAFRRMRKEGQPTFLSGATNETR